MPELPEVETTRRGIAPHVTGQKIRQVVVRDARLRWPVTPALARSFSGQTILEVRRRAKYLLFCTATGTAILHLGMSGHLRLIDAREPPGKHDHVDLVFTNGKALRLTDPRRFGALLWTRQDPHRHKLLSDLGPEPLTAEFDGKYLFEKSRHRKVCIKAFIMNARIVVGVGNIYANEALFMAGIHPARMAGRISRTRYEHLVQAIKTVLSSAIAQGGTTLRDFLGSDGSPGYFSLSLQVYQREGEPCPACGSAIKMRQLGQRSTFYCSRCQR